MKKTVASIAAAMVLTPMILQAGGIGVYIPYSMGHKSTGTFYSASGVNDDDFDYTLKDKLGLGLAFATNLGKEDMMGYKLGLEYTNPEFDNFPDSATKIGILNTLEFAVYSNEVIKLWLGPRLNLGYEWYDKNGYSYSGMEIGIAPATGINVNLPGNVSITFDLDYKFAWQGGSAGGDASSTKFAPDTFDAYTSSPTGMTARLGVMYRFGEEDAY